MTEAAASEPVEAICVLAGELSTILGVAKAMVEAGRIIDLAGFQDQIGLLCAKSLDLPPDEGRRIRPRLIALSGSMEALTRALQKAAPCSPPPPQS